MRSSTQKNSRPISRRINGLRYGPFCIRCGTPHNRSVRIIGKDAEHLEHGLAGRGRGVEALLMQEQIDLERVKLGQETNEVLQAAPETIDVPGHHHVELPLGRIAMQGIERRPLVTPLSTADAVVLVDPSRLPSRHALRPPAARPPGSRCADRGLRPAGRSRRASFNASRLMAGRLSQSVRNDDCRNP